MSPKSSPEHFLFDQFSMYITNFPNKPAIPRFRRKEIRDVHYLFTCPILPAIAANSTQSIYDRCLEWHFQPPNTPFFIYFLVYRVYTEGFMRISKRRNGDS